MAWDRQQQTTVFELCFISTRCAWFSASLTPIRDPSVIQLLKIIRDFHQQSPVSAYGEGKEKHDEDFMRYFIHTFSAALWFRIKITHEEGDSSL